ncbi:Panacea domain-containing protein [Brucellaceae bacterium D45D]
MAYTPQHVANYFITRAANESVPLTPLKLVKLVYIAYGWVLALTNEKLFNEPIEAWKHGPVIPSVYHEFKDFGSAPIGRNALNIDYDSWEIDEPEIPSDDKQVHFILDRVWTVYKGLSGSTLRNKTHEADTPWTKVFEDGVRGIKLRDEDIKEHFAHKIRGYLDGAKKLHRV